MGVGFRLPRLVFERVWYAGLGLQSGVRDRGAREWLGESMAP